MIVSDLLIDEYHSRPDVSKSGLDIIAQSPHHYWARKMAQDRPPEPVRGGQLEGSLAHCAILEPDQFFTRYAIGPTVNRNTKAWKEFVEANPDRIALQDEQVTAAFAQARAVRAIPDVADLLSSGAAEVSAFWTDESTGVACRCRPDWAHPVGDDAVILLDVKTYSDASPEEFRRQVARKRYHVQDAFYSDGYEAASGLRVLAFVFVAVETAYPYAASACMLGADDQDVGRRLYKADLATFQQCQQTGVWPGYGDTINLINLPAWAKE